MKKKVLVWMLGVTMAIGVAACGTEDKNSAAEGTEAVQSTESGSTEESSSEPAASSVFDLKGSDYVKLCDYSDFEITIAGDYEVEEQEVKAYFEQMFTSYGPFYTDDPDKTTIEEGDIVDVDYVGKLDGVAFDGGSAEHQIIDVYNNTSASGSGYIEGFTEGLKGASVGDVIDCDVTFPEDYGNTELAGKEVVFTFTVNAIQKEMSIDEVDDAFAKEQFQVDTVEEMYQEVRSYLESAAEYNKERDKYLAVQEYLLDNCTVEMPQDYLSARLSDYKRQYIAANCSGDESQLEAYLSDYYGKTVEEMEEYWSEAMTRSVKLELIMDVITEELGVDLNEEEYDAYVTQLVSNQGYGSEDTMYASYGYGDAAYGKEYFRDLYMYDIALEKVLSNVTVKEETPEQNVQTDGTEALEVGTENLEDTETK